LKTGQINEGVMLTPFPYLAEKNLKGIKKIDGHIMFLYHFG